MKKEIFILALMLVTLGANAQRINNGEVRDSQHIIIAPDSYVWGPFNDATGYSYYGSRYRKAKAMQEWGVVLSVAVAPLGGVLIAHSIKQNVKGGPVVGGLIVAAGLGAGIPLWVKGRRELDWMLDDYTKRYAPKPYSSSVTAGPTMNGVGLAFNF